MRLLQRFAAATMLLASTATMASAQMVSAQNSGQNDSVDYAPRVHTVAGTLPLDTHYTLEVSAPTQLNQKGEEALPNGIPAELRVNVASYPVGSTPEVARALVSVDPSSMVFYYNLVLISTEPRSLYRTPSDRRHDSSAARSCAEEASWDLEGRVC
jgi:hypothetical protein